MKIGYSKVGRSWKLDPTKGTATGGDADVARTLHILARDRPQDTFYLIGRNSSERPQDCGYPDNVINPWTELTSKFLGAKLGDDTDAIISMLEGFTHDLFMEMDQQIVWAGQHGTSNSPLPTIEDRNVLTVPQVSFIKFASYIFRGINAWRSVDPLAREEIWLCPDPRNYLKGRDLQWPLRHPVIGQFDMTTKQKFERYGAGAATGFDGGWDPKAGEGVWLSPTEYIYGGLELTALPHPSRAVLSTDHGGRYDFGMIVNENRAYVAKNRLSIMEDWVLPNWPDAEIFGKWSKSSLDRLQRNDIRPCPYEHLQTTMQRWRCTLTTPASGRGWATAKPWECFAYGVVCFFHPQYDTQGHIIMTDAQLSQHGHNMDPNDFALASWLRVSSPEQLKQRVDYLAANPDAWEWIINEQRKYYERAYAATRGGVYKIEERLER